MKKFMLACAALAVFAGFIIPASKMASLMKAQNGLGVLVLNGTAFFNLGKAYSNTPVPCRIIVTANGTLRQDYLFPRAHITLINAGIHQFTLVNGVRLASPVGIFEQNNVAAVLFALYLSDNPGRVFNEIGVNQAAVAYGLANNRAAYIIGTDADQLFIDNEDTVPLMYRITAGTTVILSAVKDYMTSAGLLAATAVPKPAANAGDLSLITQAGDVTQTAATLPRIVELYNGNTLVQRWEFDHALLLHSDAVIKALLPTPYEISRLRVTDQPLSPFMLF